jgi:PAS domain S-box-containing protein
MLGGGSEPLAAAHPACAILSFVGGLVDQTPAVIPSLHVKGPAPSQDGAFDSVKEIKEHFLQMAQAIHEVLWISQVDFFRFVYVSPAFETIWGIPCEDLYQHPESIIDSIVPEDRMRWVTAMAEQALHPHTEIEYRVLRPEGAIRWIRTRLFPIREGHQDVLRVAGISEDITDRKLAEREILEISARERQKMGQEVHDGICQHLTGVSYMLKSLEQDLTSGNSELAVQATHMNRLLRDTINRARRLARGLYPVEIEAHGLMAALRELTHDVKNLYDVECTFDAPEPVQIMDHVAATHLYRITQEAVMNAITHGQASKLVISLINGGGVAYLRIRDNGNGVTQDPERPAGMGLRIMHHRARMIGAKLTVQNEPGDGLIIYCAIPLLQLPE